MAEDRSLWALERALRGRRRGEVALGSSNEATTDARRTLEWIRHRLEELRQKRAADASPPLAAVGGVEAGRPRRTPRRLR
jgi:hypothetical protein